MSEEQQEELKRTEKERAKEKKSYKKPLIVCVVILVILVILGLIIYFIVNSQDKEAQVKEFKKSIEKKDYDKLSNLLTTNEKNEPNKMRNILLIICIKITTKKNLINKLVK